MSSARWVCPSCGSGEVEGLGWVDLNTGALVSWDECSEYWCPRCEDHFKRVCEVNAQGFCSMHGQPQECCREAHRPVRRVSR